MSDATFEFEPLAHTPMVDDPVAVGVSVAEASGIIEAARAEAGAIRETARAEGFQAGYDAGLAAAADRLAPIASTLESAAASLGAARETAADQVEAHAVDLAIRIAEKTLGATIEARPEHVVDVVRGGLRRLIERDRVLILVHPDDMQLVRDAVTALKSELGGIGDLDVQAERRVSRGGAIVRTQAGEVDGRLETQLERARETLLAALTASGSPEDQA